jgi:NADPH:quinone reductase-like Zn-dependent oxidoreductase/NAD(P)-dependent dehydrogenase (short-subunit alcohol dehydrogenase family)/acyl carrier protein/SAM-dependent methyltransferase
MLKDDVASSQGVAFVPARIGRLRWIKNRGTPHVVQARLVKRTRHSLTAEFALFDAQGQQIAVVGEARFRSVRLAKAHTDTLAFLDYASIPNPHPAAQSAPNPALLTDALYTRLQTAVQSVHQDGSLASYAQEIEPLLESLCHSYGAQALHALSNEGRLNRDALDALRCAAPEAAPLLGWLLSRVAEADADGAQWTVEDPAVEEVTAADIWNSLAREYPGAFAIVHAVGRTGLHLPALLAGEAAPADIRSPNATPASLMRRALGNPANQRIAHALRACLTDALDARAAGQRVRVMEIGADAPQFAPHLCEGLDFHVADFAYASPSQDALEEAEFLLDRFPDLQLQKVGAERVSWAGQADLVVLQCGFENNDALEQSLTHAAASLKPGGTLLLCAMHPAAWLDFVFGTHESWWIDAADGSRLSPQRSVDDWRATLSRHGLHCGQVLELAAGAASGPFLLMASSNAATDSIAMPEVEESDGWLILTDPLPAPQAAIAEELARRLSETHGMSVTVEPVVSAGDVHAIIGRVRSELGRIAGIVHLAGFTRHDPQRPLADSDPHALLDGQVRRCAITAALAQACERVGIEARLWLLTAGAAPFLPATSEAGNESLNDASLWHYGRTLANEAEGFDVHLVDLPLTGRLPFDALTRELLWPDAEQEVALASESERYVPRMRKNPRPHARPAGTEAQEPANGVRLAFEVPGQLRNLRWESFVLAEPGAHEIEVEVKATGLNFRDVMYTLGLLLDEAIENGFAGPTLGLEFAGVVTRVGADVSGYRTGDAVVGFGPASFGNRVITSEGAISPIPRAMSFEAAATIPSTFFTVYYGLEHLAGLERGERVLIHGAAGGVGIAAIQFAQWKGAEIHATAGSDEKRDFLRLMGVEHIYDSRSLDFADEILARTGGEGVDVVLNSLAGEAINRNLSVLKPFGRFLELGKRDFYENTRVGLRPFRNNISYFGIDADQLMSVRPALTRRLFGEVMKLFEQGVLHPLPYEVFDANDVVDAFRHMQQARQIGKIVVAYERGIRAVVPGRAVAAPETVLSLPSQASYLVTGGLSGFGLRTAEWLADKGARHLILISRSGPASDEARETVTALRERGVTVLAASCDVTRREALADLLALAKERMPPIRGIVHAAMVIDDGLVRNADASRIARVMAPKILGALHLDELTRDLPLDFFVFHSSGTTLFGNPGQSGYVAANGWLEALARRRRSQGRCATSPRWGAIADAGFLARNAKVKDALQSRMGGSALPAADALRVLEAMLLSGTTDLGVLELDWRSLARFLPSAETPKFAWIARGATFAQQDSEGGEAIEHLLSTLDDAELHPVVMSMLKREIGAILRVPDERIDPDRSVYDMGLDSLMGVELVVALENRFGIRLPVMALSETPTISRLAARLIGMLRGDESNQPDEIALQVAQVVAQHADGISSDAIANFAEAVKADEHAPRQRLIQ